MSGNFAGNPFKKAVFVMLVRCSECRLMTQKSDFAKVGNSESLSKLHGVISGDYFGFYSAGLTDVLASKQNTVRSEVLKRCY